MKIRVSNLDRTTTSEDLQSLFEDFGDVLKVVLNGTPDPTRDTFTAFVTMSYDWEAEEAVQELNGERIDGREIKVRPAHLAENEKAKHPTYADENDELEPAIQERIVRRKPLPDREPERLENKNRRRR